MIGAGGVARLVDGDGVDVLEEDPTRARPMSSVAHGAWIVGQSVLAVVFGAGLFVAFDQLWKWNNIVALVLSVLVSIGAVEQYGEDFEITSEKPSFLTMNTDLFTKKN